jgi:hypothetical protein
MVARDRSISVMSEPNTPVGVFFTWSMDVACKKLGLTRRHGAEIEVTDNLLEVENSNLTIFGVFGPSEKGEGSSNPLMSGKAKEYDTKFGSVITEMMEESYETLKCGSVVGSSTPITRIVNDGMKVSA